MSNNNDIDGILRGGVHESHDDFNEALGAKGIQTLTPVFEKLNTPEEIRKQTERILSGEDGSVELPATAAKAMSEAGLLKGYTLALGKKIESVSEGWCEAGVIKHERPEEKDSHGVWESYRVGIHGVDTPIMTEVWLKAREVRGTLDRDFTTWVLSRGPLGSGIRIQRA